MSVQVSQPNASLVKYDTQILVSTSGKSKGGQSFSDTQASKNEDYLNSLLPPKEFMEGGQLWVQYVSPTPATKQEVILLQEELDKRLQQRQARETGICPIREELYMQTFDELIREITINCAERGFLLARVKDEIKMTIQAYQTLFESSIAFGMRKSLQAEQRKAEMYMKVQQLDGDNQELEDQVSQLEQEICELLEREKQQMLDEEDSHAQEMEKRKGENKLLAEKVKVKLLDLQHS